MTVVETIRTITKLYCNNTRSFHCTNFLVYIYFICIYIFIDLSFLSILLN